MEIKLKDKYEVVKKNGEDKIRVFNGFKCKGIVNFYEIEKDKIIKKMELWKEKNLRVDGENKYKMEIYNVNY